MEQSLREANSKINGYELQIVKLTNQIKLLEAELERLSEKAKSKYLFLNFQTRLIECISFKTESKASPNASRTPRLPRTRKCLE